MPFSLVILAGRDRAERRLVDTWPTNRRAVPTAPGVGRTRHPMLGAADQPSVAPREPSSNQRLTTFPVLQSAGAARSVDLMKIKRSEARRVGKERRSRSAPYHHQKM